MTTLEARYSQKIAEFRALSAKLPERRHEVERLSLQLKTLRESDPAFFETKDALDLALKRVQEAENAQNAEVQYMLEAAPFIREYNEYQVSDPEPQRKQSAPKGSLHNFFVVNSSSNRNDVLQRYLHEVEKKCRPELVDRASSARDLVCERCDVALLVCARDAELVCPQCGVLQHYMDMSSACLTYEETWSRDVVSSFAYKRMNHFTEWLNSLQAKENTDIPDEVIEAVKAEFKKARTTTRGEIKPTKVREFLKKLKLNKYYEHVHHICNQLNGCPAPKLPPALEDRLKKMFAEIQRPFEKHCPPTRKNFLSYSYTLYKFCELLGEDQYLQYFPLLKSSEKLYLQDQIWRNICKELGWEFIRSV